jgi:hypothetical protein
VSLVTITKMNDVDRISLLKTESLARDRMTQSRSVVLVVLSMTLLTQLVLRLSK